MICLLRSDPNVMKYTGRGIQSKDEVQKFLDTAIPYQKNMDLAFVLSLKKKQVILYCCYVIVRGRQINGYDFTSKIKNCDITDFVGVI